MKKMFLRLLPMMVVLSIALSSCYSYPQSIPVTGPPTATFLPTAVIALSAIPMPRATNVPLLSDDVWDRIMANHKIVVGTAWDYPPFASVDSNFQVVGYDIELIKEIGTRLNLPVEIQNFSFEGLQSALQINQIDLAVAAISITPERASQMTFSPVYYVNQTAILARADSSIPAITNINQMTGYRIGVESGTTYEKWVQQSLVDAKLMPSSQLLSYMKAKDAVRDLQANRVDLVVIGQATASYYNAQKGLRMVGKGSDQQNLAVAMRLGTPRLKTEIDRVMGDMLNDGTILTLIQKYIQNDVAGTSSTPMPPVQPTAYPPVPTATAAACVDGMKFVADVTYGDNNMQNLPLLNPGASFVKTWRLQNTGTCAWTPDYKLVYAYGNGNDAQMNGQQVSIPGNVAPGSIVDVSAVLVAPQTLSVYQGFWQMQNAKGERFGQTIWVGITTDPNQTASTVPTTGPVCTVTLISPINSIKTSQDFNVVWTVSNASGRDWNTGTVDYRYISGTAMHKKSLYDIAQSIKNGESGTFIVDMAAPATAGTYSTQWAIVASSSTLCNMLVTVTVVN